MSIFETETHIERNASPRAIFALANDMWVERGTKADWDLLHDLHYKAEKLPLGPRFYKLTLYGETIGVLVTGLPKGELRERHIVFPKLKPGNLKSKMVNTNRYNYINAHFRVISRFVVDTMYRGIGAGYRMMNLVSRIEGNTFMEIQSSMSKFNVFGQKAGFSFVRPMNANKFEAGMKFFRLNFEGNPQDFEGIVAEIESSEDPDRLTQICREWYLKNSATENTGSARDRAEARVAAMSARELVKGIQQIALASPMYGIWQCPDPKGTVPERLPLLAFDNQGPKERLKL
jgi:ABC-type ATPase with predicted acetyltransferase domain